MVLIQGVEKIPVEQAEIVPIQKMAQFPQIQAVP